MTTYSAESEHISTKTIVTKRMNNSSYVRKLHNQDSKPLLGQNDLTPVHISRIISVQEQGPELSTNGSSEKG